MKLKIFVLISLFLALSNAAVLCAAEPSKVLILPFTVHADKDMSFLKDGIADMLTTRLSRDELVPIAREETMQASQQISGAITEKTAVSLAEKFAADYVAYGSVTVLGDTISTDAKFYDLRKKKNIVIFNQTGKNSGDVISHISLFANQVNNTLFKTETATAAPVVQPAATVEKSDDESRRNPETLWNEKKTGIAVANNDSPLPKTSPPLPAPVPSVVTTEQPVAVPVSGSEMWKSPSLKAEVRGIAVVDVDGDGKNEIVMMTQKDILIYRYTNGTFVKIKEISGGDTLLGVDAADINGNGKAEIFVTNLIKNNEILSSYVLEWNGTKFDKITDKQRWYYRLIDVPNKGKVLMGQKRGVKDIFMGGIVELRWDGREYAPSKEQGLPPNVSVFGFAYGDVLNTGREMTMIFAENERLRLLDKEGKEEWRSNDAYGGTSLYMEKPEDVSGRVGAKEGEHYYLPQRIWIRDIDKDGKTEVIVAKNTDATGRYFTRFRLFKSGYIACLAYDNMGMYEKWKTREISGHISDYVLADIDNDGKDELIFSVVAQSDSAFGDPKSFIVVQKLN